MIKEIKKIERLIMSANKKSKVKNDTDITNALGTLVLSFSTLEFSFKRFFSFITDIDERISWAIVTELGFAKFLDLLKDVANVKYKNKPKFLKYLSDLIRKSKEVNSKRNIIIHSYWYKVPNDVKNTIRIFKPNKSLDFEINKKSELEIKNVVEDINSVTTDLMNLILSNLFQKVKKLKYERNKMIKTLKKPLIPKI